MSGRYILDGKRPVPCEDLLAWGMWFESADRHVAVSEVGPFHVSTVFLGLDHSFGGDEPVLFETMVFGEKMAEDYQTRCSTWEQAEAMHSAAEAWARGKLS